MLFVLHDGPGLNSKKRVDLVLEACRLRSIECTALDASSLLPNDVPLVGLGDGMVNLARGGGWLETRLLNEEVATIYSTAPVMPETEDSTKASMVLDREGIPAPNTVYGLSGNSDQLERAIEYLGGFPIVAKALGGTLGVGTVILETERSLRSFCDLAAAQSLKFCLRSYIPNQEIWRVCVVGKKAVVAGKKRLRSGDFRSTLTASEIEWGEPPGDLADLALRACAAVGVEFCGCDLVLSPTGQPLVLEVNPPFNFVAPNEAGYDIAGALVDWLNQKMIGKIPS